MTPPDGPRDAFSGTDGVDLDPGVRRWIADVRRLAPAAGDSNDADPIRARSRGREISDLLADVYTLPSPDGVQIDEFSIDGGSGPRRVRRYRLHGLAGPTPSVLWMHGGGFVGGDVDESINDRLISRRVCESGIQHLSLDYRLAPEHLYPSPVDDAVAVIQTLVARPDEYGVDPRRLGIGGTSAGAAVAASASLRLRGTGISPIAHVDLEVPVVAMRPVGPAATEFGSGFGLDGIDALLRTYLGPHSAFDEYVSPLDVADLSGLPPHLIMVAEYDPLRDAGIEYANRLRAAGVAVELYIGAGHLHGTPGLTAVSPRAAQWQSEHSRLLSRAYRVEPAQGCTG